ncbi:MAG: type II toxin-antitoxin system RelE/ParE family toxin [Bacteroidetes bacterium]|nr:type II toxin-antitoxin system RelE/ParE family toxin [Bacteroidota bacterium]
MSFEIVVTQAFRRAAKALKKRYRSFDEDLGLLIDSLEKQPVQGIEIRPNCYKIKIAISSKGKGKSVGARVITFIEIQGEKVFLLLVYDKSERDNISDKELDEILKEIE